MIPDTYKKLIEKNPKLEFLKWDQYHSYDGDFKIDNVEISGDFTEYEIDNFYSDISNFLEDHENLLDLFGNQVTVKLKKLNSIEIIENSKI